MTISGLRPRLVALLTAILACVGLLSLSTAPAWARAGTIKEFPIPTQSAPIGITAGPDGNLWFTDIVFGVGEIGRITPSGRFTLFPVPTASSMPEGITAGPDGNLWFTELDGNKIGRITTTGSITEFPLNCGSNPGCGPFDITAGPDGNLWFTEFDANAIGRITPSGSLTGIFGIPTAKSRPEGITAGPVHTSDLWFAEENASKIGRITTK